MRLVVGLLLAGFLLAGCAESSVTPPADVPAPASSSASPVRVSTSPVQGNASNEFAIEAAGEAGSWIILHLPFARPWDSGGYSTSYEIIVDAAQGSGAFLWPLGFTRAEGDGWAIARLPVFHEHLLTFDADQTWNEQAGLGFGTSDPYEGLVFALAAGAPWTLSFSIELDGMTFGNHSILQGANATFSHGGTALVPVPGAGPANQVTFAATSPGLGWSHLELLRQRLEPDGVSQITLELANGDSASQLGTQNGHSTPLTGGSAGGGHLDALGSMTDVAGDVSGEATFARADLAMEFGYVHLPFDPGQLPGLVAGMYAGSTWPFEDLPLPP